MGRRTGLHKSQQLRILYSHTKPYKNYAIMGNTISVVRVFFVQLLVVEWASFGEVAWNARDPTSNHVRVPCNPSKRLSQSHTKVSASLKVCLHRTT